MSGAERIFSPRIRLVVGIGHGALEIVWARGGEFCRRGLVRRQGNGSHVVPLSLARVKLDQVGEYVRIQSLRFAHWADLITRTQRNLRDGLN